MEDKTPIKVNLKFPLLIISAVLLITYGCSTSKNQKATNADKSTEILLQKATYTPWSSGIKKDNDGGDYRISLEVKVESVVKSVCINGVNPTYKLMRNGEFLEKDAKLNKGDVILITAAVERSKEQESCESTSGTVQAYVMYDANKKSKTVIIESFVKLEVERRP